AAMALRNIRLGQLIWALFPIRLALAGCIGAAAQSQSTTESAGFTRTARLKEGTEARLKLRDKLTSKTAVEGDPVNLMLDQDLKVGNITVAKAGALAVGTISHADEWRTWMKVSTCRLLIEPVNISEGTYGVA